MENLSLKNKFDLTESQINGTGEDQKTKLDETKQIISDVSNLNC